MMPSRTAAWLLFSTLVVCGLVEAALILSAYAKELIEQASLLSLLFLLLKVYGVFVTLLMGWLFGVASDVKVPCTAFGVTLFFAIVWNGLTLWRVWMFFSSPEQKVGDLTEFLQKVPPLAAFAVSAGVGFLISKGERVKSAEDKA